MKADRTLCFLGGFSLWWTILTIWSAAEASYPALPILLAFNATFTVAAFVVALLSRCAPEVPADNTGPECREATEPSNVVVTVNAPADEHSTMDNAPADEHSTMDNAPADEPSTMDNAPADEPSTMDNAQRLLLITVCAFYVLFCIRLLCADHFKGKIADLDFGLKPFKNGTRSRERNRSYDSFDFPSVGHTAQGLCAVFFFPACINLCVVCLSGKAAVRVWTVLYLMPIGLIIYPIYNLVKRAIKSHDKFAISSFANNGAEWACGAMLGICIGLFVSALTAKSCAIPLRQDSRKTPRKAPTALKIIMATAGILLNVALVSAIVLFATSWDAEIKER